MGVTSRSTHPTWIRPCYLITLVLGCRSVDVTSDRTCSKILPHFARSFLLFGYELQAKLSHTRTYNQI